MQMTVDACEKLKHGDPLTDEEIKQAIAHLSFVEDFSARLGERYFLFTKEVRGMLNQFRDFQHARKQNARKP